MTLLGLFQTNNDYYKQRLLFFIDENAVMTLLSLKYNIHQEVHLLKTYTRDVLEVLNKIQP